MLTKAKDVVAALDAAEGAQNKANDAIKKANMDIELAKSDLEQVNAFDDRTLKNINVFLKLKILNVEKFSLVELYLKFYYFYFGSSIKICKT